jgi:adenylyltransferase/sulfurtransferase
VLFGTADVGAPKAETAMAAVARINPDVKLIPINARIDADNARLMLREADVVLDGCDSFATRLAVADAAQGLRIPLVSAAVGAFEGQLSTYRGWEADKPCYRCLVGSPQDAPERNCAETGVIGALTGVMGSLAALEVIRAIMPFGVDMAGKLLLADLLSMRFRTLSVAKDPACAACAPLLCDP